MCLVSTAWKKDQISWRVLEEGRLLHVRLHGHSRCIDIINGYQYTMHTKDQTCRDNRKRWVDQLDTLLLSLPKRNLLYLGVDLNTSLQQWWALTTFMETMALNLEQNMLTPIKFIRC